MKNAMKKLMAFALVAVMLVGVLPFAAFAAPIGETGCDTENPDLCTNDYPMHDAGCVKVCNGSETCYPGSVAGLKEYHLDGCKWLAAKIAEEEEAARKEAEEAAKRDTNNCTMDDNCPVIVPYHKVGCVKVAKHNEPIDDGNKCTHDFDCKHTGNLHVASCPMIPCTGDANCDHGGFYHKEGCPFVCNGKSNCPQAANQDARYHVADCASLNVKDENESNKPEDNTQEDGEYAYAYIYVGNSNSASRIYKNERAFSIGAVVDKFDTEDTEKHYAFDYYTIDGVTGKYDDVTDVVYPGETARIYVKVTESKLNHNKVYLQIFMNNDFDVPAKTINVTTMATENGLYREGNVKDLILEYFSAKSSTGIKIDGMYPSTGSWVAKFLEDTKVKNVSNDEIVEMKEDDYVVFNIMVTNAKLKSSGTADSTNPKTADNIYAVVTIMTASAAALAAAFYLNKKRAF